MTGCADLTGPSADYSLVTPCSEPQGVGAAACGTAGETAVSTTTGKQHSLVMGVAAPLCNEPAILRLDQISFLGLLSCRHANAYSAKLDDGTRHDHSMGVAALAWRITEHLELGERAGILSVAWGLTHDIANWAMSHSSEPAFELSTGMTSREIRTAIITDSTAVASSLHVGSALRHMGVKREDLCELFLPRNASVSRDLRALHSVLRGVLSPDALEGMTRTAQAFGRKAPPIEEIISALAIRGGEVGLLAEGLDSVLTFWDLKSAVYLENINDPKVTAFESRWARLLSERLGKLNVDQSMALGEEELLQIVSIEEAYPRGVERVFKYKPPARHGVSVEMLAPLGEWISLQKLGSLLVSHVISPSPYER